MIIEWWWFLLLLPMFFILGWWAARLDKKQTIQAAESLPSSYFHGLNFLLNEQADQAIDAFIQVVKVDPETLELHFTLANLFRRRGEIDRAIKIHQHLCARTDLPDDKKAHAQYELGLDFLKAGMFDRAEQLLTPLGHTSYGLVSQVALLQVYEQTRMWPEALSIAKQLESHDQKHYQALQVHFYCELIELVQAFTPVNLTKIFDQAHQLADAQHQQRMTYLQQAQLLNPAHPRLLWLQALIAYSRHDQEEATRCFELLYEQGGVAMLLAVPVWANMLFQENAHEQALSLLQRCYASLPSMSILKLWSEQHVQYHGQEKTEDAILTWLKANPNLWLYAQLLIVRTKKHLDPSVVSDDVHTETNIVQQLLAKRLSQQEQFICGHCGFRARQHYWQCPGCHQWDTLTPLAL